MGYFLQGLTMGLAYVAPIGLQNLFVINSALAHTRRRALITALIVIFFDVTLALACCFGIGALMERFQLLNMMILLAGGIIVVLIGISLLRSRPEDQAVSNAETSIAKTSINKTICSACVVTWFNPQALIDGTMMLGAFHAALPASKGALFMIGVASASCLWFAGLTLIISISSRRFSPKLLRIINIVCGIIIIFYGMRLLFSFIQSL